MKYKYVGLPVTVNNREAFFLGYIGTGGATIRYASEKKAKVVPIRKIIFVENDGYERNTTIS